MCQARPLCGRTRKEAGPGSVFPGSYVFLRGASREPSVALCLEGQFKGRVETVPSQMQNGGGPDSYIFAFATIPSCRFNLPLFLAEVMVPSIISALLHDILEVTLITSPCSSSLKDRVEELKPLGWKE